VYLADILSSAYLPTTARSPAEERINADEFVPISEPHLNGIQHETAADPVLQSLTHVILRGWSQRKVGLPAELHPINYVVRDEHSAQGRILFKGLRCNSRQSGAQGT